METTNLSTKILVHSCCGPCSTYVFKRLREQGFAPYAYYYNPNIYPLEEYEKRKKTFNAWCKKQDIPRIDSYYDPEEYYEALDGEVRKPPRCEKCFRLRLSKTAFKGAQNGFRFFTTTLLISPYQDHKLIQQIGDEEGAEVDIGFYYEDFVRGYNKSCEISKEEGMYRQKYCGCKYSLAERKEREKSN